MESLAKPTLDLGDLVVVSFHTTPVMQDQTAQAATDNYILCTTFDPTLQTQCFVCPPPTADCA